MIILWLIFSSIQFLLVKRQATFQLLVLIPGLTFLITQFFLNIGKGMVGKLAFLILLFGLPAGGWWFYQIQQKENTNYFVCINENGKGNPNEKIMVLSEDSSPFCDNSLGGPFLNFNLTKAYLESEKTLEQKARIFQNLSNQMPQTVIDPSGIFRNLLEELPALKNLYTESQPGIFRLK